MPGSYFMLPREEEKKRKEKEKKRKRKEKKKKERKEEKKRRRKGRKCGRSPLGGGARRAGPSCRPLAHGQLPAILTVQRLPGPGLDSGRRAINRDLAWPDVGGPAGTGRQ